MGIIVQVKCFLLKYQPESTCKTSHKINKNKENTDYSPKKREKKQKRSSQMILTLF